MAATVKTLLEHHGELYWGTRKANPGYCYGLALDVGADGLAAELVYVMSDLDENDEPLVTPETLVSCFTVNDLEDNGIILSNYLDTRMRPRPWAGTASRVVLRATTWRRCWMTTLASTAISTSCCRSC
ncbi:MAG: hypothetical protein ACLR3C_16220 [Eggerthella lenta]